MTRHVRFLLGSASILMASSFAAYSDTHATEQLVNEARAKTKAFGKQLKATLSQELKTNGAMSAVAVCHEQAPGITLENSKGDWDVSRTSLKVRNPGNAPDLWEAEVLQQFEQKLANGAEPSELEYSAIWAGEFRYMKAIPTGQVCLACHGSQLDDGLKAHIETLYPEDQATGFSVGQLRGAFSLKKSLK